MNWLDIILPTLLVATAVGLMVWKYKDSGEPFNYNKFGTALITTLGAAGAVASTTFGDNMAVTGSGFFGAIMEAILSGAGVVMIVSTGAKAYNKVKGN